MTDSMHIEPRTPEEEAARARLIAFDAARPTPTLPTGWWRRFEPEWSCGPYYLYGYDREGTVMRSHEIAKRDLEVFSACELGVNAEDMPFLYHDEPELAEALAAVLLIAAADSRALAALAESRQAVASSLPEVGP